MTTITATVGTVTVKALSHSLSSSGVIDKTIGAMKMVTVTIVEQKLLENNVEVTWSNGAVTVEDYRIDSDGLQYAEMFRDDELLTH